jgi:hypothetical protein
MEYDRTTSVCEQVLKVKNRGSACSGVRYCGEKAWVEWSMEALFFRQVGELFRNTYIILLYVIRGG